MTDKEQLVETEVARRLSDIQNNLSSTIQNNRTERLFFENRLNQQWGEAFDLFEAVLMMSSMVSRTLFNKHLVSARQEDDHSFIALSAIQARACVAAGGVLALLRAGYPQDALARWRTVYELACIATFIKEKRGDVAERYLLHETIEIEKLAKRLQDHQTTLGETAVSEEVMQETHDRKDELIKRFGKEFAEPNGWAAHALQARRVTFTDVEKSINMQDDLLTYKIASWNIHSDHSGYKFNIGKPILAKIQLYGPSNYGLASAGIGTLRMLALCTATFISERPSFDIVVTIRVLHDLTTQAQDTFHRIRVTSENPP